MHRLIVAVRDNGFDYWIGFYCDWFRLDADGTLYWGLDDPDPTTGIPPIGFYTGVTRLTVN